MYFVALAITIVGVVVYNSKQPVNSLETQLMVEDVESKSSTADKE